MSLDPGNCQPPRTY